MKKIIIFTVLLFVLTSGIVAYFNFCGCREMKVCFCKTDCMCPACRVFRE